MENQSLQVKGYDSWILNESKFDYKRIFVIDDFECNSLFLYRATTTSLYSYALL